MNLNGRPDNLLRETVHNYTLRALSASAVGYSDPYSPQRRRVHKVLSVCFDQKLFTLRSLRLRGETSLAPFTGRNRGFVRRRSVVVFQSTPDIQGEPMTLWPQLLHLGSLHVGSQDH